MVGIKVDSVRKIFAFVILVTFICSSCCVNVGIMAGDLKRLNPTLIKKYSQNSPVFINIKSEKQPLKGELLRKLPAKPPPMKRSIPKLKTPRKLPRSIFNVPKLPLVPFVLPIIPRTPLLPLFPHWLPTPTVPTFPIHQPIAKLSDLLGWEKRNDQMLDKLLDLKRKGSLTTAEYIRFRKLLLK